MDYRIEPLGPAHDRRSFECGVAPLDEYLHQRASQDIRRKVAAAFVMLDDKGAIVGYYTLSAYSILLKELPEAFSAKLPEYPLLPATLLGRLAVSQCYRGRNLGRFLLVNALRRSWESTKNVGSAGVVVEAMNDAATAFYLKQEFVPFVGRSDKLFMPMTTIDKAFGIR